MCYVHNQWFDISCANLYDISCATLYNLHIYLLCLKTFKLQITKLKI